MCSLLISSQMKRCLTWTYLMVLFVVSSVKGHIEEGSSSFILECPKEIETFALQVVFEDGQNETFATFHLTGCTAHQPGIVCQNFINSAKYVIVPVTVRSRAIVSYSCNSAIVYKVIFYAKPSNISCTIPSLDVTGTSVSVICRTSKIFPQAGCKYFDMTNKVPFKDKLLTVKQEAWGSPVYYSAECSLNLPLSTLTQGRFEIQVLIYPMVENGLFYGINYTIRPDVVLGPVNISLDSRCLQGSNIINGYIKNGTEATCKCKKTSHVDTIARVNWYNNNTLIVLNETDPSSCTLTLSYPRDFNKTYKCRVKPFALDPNGIEIAPRFAFGPSQVYVTSDEVTINVCPLSMTTTNTSCWAPWNDISPDVTIGISTDRPDIVKTSIGPENSSPSNLSYAISISALKGGKYVMNCSLINTVFREFNAAKRITIIAREAPKDQPMFIINGGHPIKEGISSENVNFTCFAPGGYPTVSKLTVSCLGQTIDMEGNYWSIKMNLKRKDNGSMCTCTAHHETGCYVNNTVKHYINITYNVNITNFTGNNDTELEVEKGEDVTFICEAESNPKPIFTLQIKDTDRRRPSNFTLVVDAIEMSKNKWQAKYIWNKVSCVDTNKYTCVTSNVYYEVSMEQSIRLFVKCSIQVLNDSLQGEEIQTEIGGNAVISLEVLGHPKPAKFELFKGIKMSAVDINMFNVTFTESVSPYGNITLTLQNLQNDDLTFYTLIVYNGIGNPLKYRFILMKAREEVASTTPAIIGGVLGGVIFVILICIGVFICRKKDYCTNGT